MATEKQVKICTDLCLQLGEKLPEGFSNWESKLASEHITKLMEQRNAGKQVSQIAQGKKPEPEGVVIGMCYKETCADERAKGAEMSDEVFLATFQKHWRRQELCRANYVAREGN